MNEYELSVLSHKDIDQLELKHKILDKINEVGGITTKYEADGVKRLAYSISGQEYAHYSFYTIQLPQDAPVKLSSWLNITDEVLRYLLVKTSNRQQTRATTPQHTSENNLNGTWS